MNLGEKLVLPFYQFMHDILLEYFPLDLCRIIHQYFEYPLIFNQKTVEKIQRKLYANHKKNHRHAAMKRMKKAFRKWFSKANLAKQAISTQSFKTFCYIEPAKRDTDRVIWPLILISVLHIQSKAKIQHKKSLRMKKSEISAFPLTENLKYQFENQFRYSRCF